MTDLRLPRPFHHPERIELPKGELLVDLRTFVFTGGPLKKRFATRSSDITWWIGEMPEGELAIVMNETSKLDRAKIVSAGAADKSLVSSSPRGIDWFREVFPESAPKIDEMTTRRLLEAYEKERGAKVRALDDLRLLPTFARNTVPTDLQARMSDELARVLALHSPQDTTVGEGEWLVLNPSFQIVRDRNLKAWYRVNDDVRERVLNEEDARLLDEMNEALGGVPREAKFEDLVSSGLLLARN